MIEAIGGMSWGFALVDCFLIAGNYGRIHVNLGLWQVGGQVTPSLEDSWHTASLVLIAQVKQNQFVAGDCTRSLFVHHHIYQYNCVKCMARADKQKWDKYLQCFQANEACNCEAINDVFLAGHRLSFPPSRRPVPSESGPTFSPARTQDTVGSTRLPIWARGQGCGPFPGKVHSPSAPFPVALRTGPSALPEPGGSARAFHVKTGLCCSHSSDTEGTLESRFRPGGRHQNRKSNTTSQAPCREPC